MKKHTTAGAEIIQKTMAGVESDTYIATATQMALSHHERWDGNGYPYGIKEKDIPLPARIMAVTDVYDALISVRPYKDAFSENEAASIISACAGTQFDPEIAEAFLVSLRNEKT